MKRKEKSVAELAEMVGGEVVGDSAVRIHGVADLDSATGREITFLADSRKARQGIRTGAGAIIVPRDIGLRDARPLILVKDPYLAVAVIHNFFITEPFSATGVSAGAVIGSACEIPSEVSIGPLVVLGDRVKLGRRVRLCPGVVIGDEVTIGDDCLLHPNVSVLAGTVIGARVVIHSGTVIGSDGFGYATDEKGRHVKRPQVGTVRIDDDVEIGANVCIDRATFGVTRVKRGTKIDNLVQLGHNVVVGEEDILVAQVGVAGSTVLGRGVVIGGQTGVAGHLEIGDRVMVAAKSGVHSNQAPGTAVAGIPAVAHKKWLRASSAFAKLPELVKDVRDLKKRLADLGRKLSSGCEADRKQ